MMHVCPVEITAFIQALTAIGPYVGHKCSLLTCGLNARLHTQYQQPIEQQEPAEEAE